MKSAALVIVFVVAASTHGASPEVGRVKRLTTFSKPPDQNTPTIAQRECKQSTECSIKGTSCREDRRDSKLRCLCEDGEPPTKGQCPNRKRALREKCNRDEECIPQAHCILNTTVVKGHKVCLCEPEVEENDGACGEYPLVDSSGSARLAEAGSLLLAFGLVAYLLEGRP